MNINKNTLVVGILALLILVAFAQTFQLVGMKNKISELGAGKNIQTGSLSKSTSSASSSSSGGGVPTNLQNLPGMVGGC